MTSTTPSYQSDTTSWLFGEVLTSNAQEISKAAPVEPPVADQRLLAWNKLFTCTMG